MDELSKEAIEEVCCRLAKVSGYHAGRAAYGGVGFESHARMQTTADDAMRLIDRLIADRERLLAERSEREAELKDERDWRRWAQDDVEDLRKKNLDLEAENARLRAVAEAADSVDRCLAAYVSRVEWIAAGSRGMHVPYTECFAAHLGSPSLLRDVKNLRRALTEPLDAWKEGSRG